MQLGAKLPVRLTTNGRETTRIKKEEDPTPRTLDMGDRHWEDESPYLTFDFEKQLGLTLQVFRVSRT